VVNSQRGREQPQHVPDEIDPQLEALRAFIEVLLPPRDPESKGIVERRNGWFETSFLPGASLVTAVRS
jgi:hypothetical protein